MASEETPLLNDRIDEVEDEDLVVKQHEAVYDRFSTLQKRTIVLLISLAGLSPLLIAGVFIPSIPQIARDLHTTGSIVNLAVSVSVSSNGIGCLCWATYSRFYGRRPIYIASLACQCLGTFGVASAQSVPQLLSWRVLQAFGASSGLSVGIAVIGDIYKLEERGTACGIFFAAVLLGSALAPVVGGLASFYYSWRVTQYGLLVFAAVSLVLTFFFQPETSQPGTRGVDKMIEERGRASWVWLNPLACLAMLRSPNILFVALAGTAALLTDYFILVPIAFTIAARYGITNEALIGALCIPLGLGNFIGAPLSGASSDWIIRRHKRQGKAWVPEDRLRATLPGALVLVPMSILLCGLITRYVEGTLGLVLNLICLFTNGLGVDFVLSPSSAYNVDILHHRSAEVSAANTALRNVIVSLSVASILPLINHLGIAVAYGIVACIAWVGFGLIWVTIRYGARMRAWVDLGFSTAADN